jgi:hypothetical protein
MAAAPGNQYARKSKDWENALRRALAQYETDKVPSGMALAKIAEKVVERALDGDQKAVEEIANRLDGKPTQATELSGPDGGTINVAGLGPVYGVHPTPEA